MLIQHKRWMAIGIATMIFLCIPLIAMQVTGEVNWSPADFLVAGFLLFGTGMLCEIIIRKVKNTGYRIAICSVVLLVLFLVWAELAVGIFGTPFAGN